MRILKSGKEAITESRDTELEDEWYNPITLLSTDAQLRTLEPLP